ncbi:MAG: hypothetical protein LBJ15_02510 [Comamonas sp.]|uniref:hypothetical protein n=1 Tax=Comamonas sp. TaxID=34028 RepID=UPI00282EA6C5|nr:hypothetical protein [Comamonas sp.]MDR0212860.1 hypothetical protein [Comamonas sp.]
MEKTFDIFMGRLGGWHTQRIAQGQAIEAVEEWKSKGYRVETEHQIGARLHEVYLVPA